MIGSTTSSSRNVEFFFQKLHTCFTSDSHELFCNHNSNIFIFSTSNIRGQASLKIYGSIIAATFVRTFNKYRQWLWWEKHTVMNSSYSRYTFVGFVYGLAPVKKNAGNLKFNFFLVCYLNQIESLVKLLISKILVLIKLPYYYYTCLPKEVFIVANATSNFSELILVLIYDIH